MQIYHQEFQVVPDSQRSDTSKAVQHQLRGNRSRKVFAASMSKSAVNLHKGQWPGGRPVWGAFSPVESPRMNSQGTPRQQWLLPTQLASKSHSAFPTAGTTSSAAPPLQPLFKELDRPAPSCSLVLQFSAPHTKPIPSAPPQKDSPTPLLAQGLYSQHATSRCEQLFIS